LIPDAGMFHQRYVVETHNVCPNDLLLMLKILQGS